MSRRDPNLDPFYDPELDELDELDELERLSNGVIDLIENGQLDEAERNCLELKRRFPDQKDWIEGSAMLHEARGQVDEAVEGYRRCIAFIERHPDDFDSECVEWYRRQIDRPRRS